MRNKEVNRLAHTECRGGRKQDDTEFLKALPKLRDVTVVAHAT